MRSFLHCLDARDVKQGREQPDTADLSKPWNRATKDTEEAGNGERLPNQEARRVGGVVRCVVMRVDKDRKRCAVSLAGDVATAKNKKKKGKCVSPSVPTKGELRLCRVGAALNDMMRIEANYLKKKTGEPGGGRASSSAAAPSKYLAVELEGSLTGRVCLTELSDQEAWASAQVDEHGLVVPSSVVPQMSSVVSAVGGGGGGGKKQKKLKHGDILWCRVLTDPSAGVVDCSLRPSRVAGEDGRVKGENVADVDAANEDPAPAVGDVVRGFVLATNGNGCFIQVTKGLTGRVQLKDLADRFIKNPEMEFPSGKLVMGKVKSLSGDGRRLDLTLRPSVVIGAARVAVGEKFKGTVTKVESFGVFVRLEPSNLTGMCHKSEAADQYITDLSKLYSVGDLVKAVILKNDPEKNRISLGLKASYFDKDDESEDDESEDEEDSDAELLLGDHPMETDEDDNKDEEESSDKSEEDEAVESEEEESDEEESSDEEADSDEEESEEDGTSPEGSDDDDKRAGTDTEKSVGNKMRSFAWDDFDVPEKVAEDEDGTEGSKRKKRRKEKEAQLDEAKIRHREESLAGAEKGANSAADDWGEEDFERALMADPNSSTLWVKYMAMCLTLASLDGARSLAHRALKTINFREEAEKLNVWLALINLEHKFGTLESLAETVRKACSGGAHPKKVQLHVAKVFEEAGQLREAEEAYMVGVKKFKTSKVVLAAALHARLKRGDDQGARDLLSSGLKSLPKHKHVYVVSQLAQFEFAIGSVERGRTVFEGLLSSYPKRVDLWNVYVDKEVKAGNIPAARNLFERLVTLKLSKKQVKASFKKWLSFETRHGDDEKLNVVKSKAKEYVQRLMDEV
uniref:S1 motif domain-containing protein n=2 Tax=Octactis speculum TaxID=3111310 RepID=A0A7S2H4N6_9STRA|mmetsp:Transcript_61357/g.84276  ORF Transcript_61357/g.84276 Transcript_61357/m.84276 type:complete len:854 (+) Transcript_61357:86-2647(+)|eukprot:CAMPEP_0185775888 /NCGR_PEP_ID=MMETSP1174-20130828/83694_1 /TAXON_ID=35687 /ORGANISM="Dictyocha speculum, Strain CCMP1381" /LENGTH=853 /DNA_ID=CAMNT_0028463621 /DNA_START=86 /DNA_END=2647 /DNA_ORIENTATION=-